MDEAIFSSGGASTVTIVLDRTGSMDGVIRTMKQYLARYLIHRIARGEDEITRFGLVTVDDHYIEEELEAFERERRNGIVVNAGPPFTAYGLTENLEEYMAWLYAVPLGEGGDDAEAFACGVDAALRLDPDASIWVVTDSIPHGWDSIYASDYFSEGCPCGIVMPARPVNVLMVSGDDLYGRDWARRGHRVVNGARLNQTLRGDEEGDPAMDHVTVEPVLHQREYA